MRHHGFIASGAILHAEALPQVMVTAAGAFFGLGGASFWDCHRSTQVKTTTWKANGHDKTPRRGVKRPAGRDRGFALRADFDTLLKIRS